VLARHLGHDRVTSEPDAVSELLACCAGLPLALGIVAARAARHPHFPLAALAAELRDQSHRLDALDLGDPQLTLRAVLSWSVLALSERAAAALGLLGLAPGPDIGLPAATSLLAEEPAATRVLLRELEDASLLQQHAPGRYRMHDLVRLYATNQDAPADALRRVVDHYTHGAVTGDRFLNPQRDPIEIGPHATGCQPPRFDGRTAALLWFDAEHACVLGALRLAEARGWHTAVWHLVWALDTFHHRRGHLRDNVACWQSGLVAAERLGGVRRTQAHAHLGIAHSRTGQHTTAVQHLARAVTLAEQAGDARTQARTHYGLALVCEQRGHFQQAAKHAADALRLYQALDDPVGQMSALNSVGWQHAHLERYEQARDACERALTLARGHDHRADVAATLDSLGYIAHRTGQHTQALAYYREALALLRDLGDAYHEADTLAQIGDTHAAAGNDTDAHAARQQAWHLYRSQHRPTDAARVQHQLNAPAHVPPG
jgi:tetratricopeptide (TPR) repeat protein